MTSTSPAADPSFAYEVIKLLLQVAWADHEVAPEEAQALRDLAKNSQVSDADQATLEGCLAGTERLPLPNLGLLREQRIEVLRMARQFLKADARVHEEEEALLEELTAVLR
jgi:uncharacterized tellurite resistance protein B-like protein